MRIPLFLISLVILSSCAFTAEKPDETAHIQALEKQVAELKQENANLQEENTLLKAGWTPPSTTVMDNSLFPAGTTFEESSDTQCMQQAKDKFIATGNAKCRESGYSNEDIANWKCQLKKETITELTTMRSNEESLCNSLYK